MTKNVILTVFITFLSYAIVSSIGTTGNYYGAPNNVSVSDSVVSRANAK